MTKRNALARKNRAAETQGRNTALGRDGLDRVTAAGGPTYLNNQITD